MKPGNRCIAVLAALFAGVLLWTWAAPQAVFAQVVTMPDGRKLAWEKVPMIEAGRQFALRLGPMARHSWFKLYVAPSQCSFAWSWRSDSNAVDAEQLCNQSIGRKLADYSSATRQRCKCVLAIEGASLDSLKASHEVVKDRQLWTTATLFATRGGGVERLRGFVGVTIGYDFLMLNEDRQPVCEGKNLMEQKPVSMSCFGGRVALNGSYKIYRAVTPSGQVHAIGNFVASDGTRIDIVMGLRDEDLAQLHPEIGRK